VLPLLLLLCSLAAAAVQVLRHPCADAGTAVLHAAVYAQHQGLVKGGWGLCLHLLLVLLLELVLLLLVLLLLLLQLLLPAPGCSHHCGLHHAAPHQGKQRAARPQAVRERARMQQEGRVQAADLPPLRAVAHMLVAGGGAAARCWLPAAGAADGHGMEERA